MAVARFIITPFRRRAMKLFQIAFIAGLGIMCLATVATSKTLNAPCKVSVQELGLPAPIIS
ncbi:hypothetical protein RCCS2_04714 [Roseobacter sp. CCS2]|nr:hypothetical protein RCCS2_04714 [Roseobacter sp. CCS2]